MTLHFVSFDNGWGPYAVSAESAEEAAEDAAYVHDGTHIRRIEVTERCSCDQDFAAESDPGPVPVTVARPPHPLAYLTVAMHFNPDLAGLPDAAARLRYNGACDLDAWRLERPTTPEGLTAHRVAWEEFQG